MTALMGCYKVSSSLFSPPVAHASSSLSQMDLLPTIVSSNLTPSRPLSQRMAKNRFWARFAQFMESKGLDINLEVFAATSALNLYEKPETFVWVVVPMAMAQYPLHLCMVIAIRVGNESLLNGDSENTWGFGQIVSLILCAAALLECVKGIVGKIGPVVKRHLLNFPFRIPREHSAPKKSWRGRDVPGWAGSGYRGD
ncbi:hypothetical protein ACHAPU_001019 [Fusarium lateritium]